MTQVEQWNGIKLTLCDYRSERITILVRAVILDGKLTVSGHDLGQVTEDFWGDDDYEYWYEFDSDNTEKLLTLLAECGDPIRELRRRFSGPDGCAALRKFCTASGIHWQFTSC